MARTVKVGLDVDEQPFVRGVGRATDAAEKLDDALDDVCGSAAGAAAATGRAKDSADDLGESAKDAGQDLNRLRRDAERLDQQIDETARGVRDLARAIAATSDEAERARLAEKLGVEQGKLRQQTSLRRLIDVDTKTGAEIGEQIAEQASVSFVQRFGPMVARVPLSGAIMNPAVAAIGAPLAAGLVVTVGTAVGGAIVGAAGAGGVIGGLVLAARDPRVKAAGTELGEDLGEMLGRASAAFVPETLGAIQTVEERVLALEPQFERVFTRSAGYLDPLLDGLLDAGENALPGIIDAVDAAEPVIYAVADGLRDLGDAVGDGLSQLAPHADEGARALRVLFFTMEWGVRGAFALVDAMSRLYKVAEIVGAVINHDVPRLISLITAQDDAKTSADDLANVLPPLADGIDDTGSAAGTAAVKVETFAEMVRRMADENLTAEQANLRLEEAIDRAADAAREGADKGIDPNTKAGRENRKALLDIAEAANTSADAILTQTGSQELAREATERGRTKFLEAADAMGVERSEALKLANQLFGIPEEVNSTVTVTANTQPALDRARGVVARINNMKARIRVEAEPSGGFGGSAHTGFGYSTGMRWGGVVEHAQDGLINLRQAAVYSPVAPARYAFAEPATGGEAFIPRFGDPDRSLGILQRAAKWYGAAVVPAGGVAAAAPAFDVKVFIGDRELTDIVDVRISARDRGLKRRVSAGAGR